MKCIQVNGIKLSDKIEFKVVHEGKTYTFLIMPYSKYEENKEKFIEPEIISECNTVIAYSSMGHNSREVYNIKIFISIVYFAYREYVEKRRKKYYLAKLKSEFPGVDEEILYSKYKGEENTVVKNWNIRGYWNVDYIEDIHWCVKLGKHQMCNDDFESYLSRSYGKDLCDSYDRRYVFQPTTQNINVTPDVIKNVDKINNRINSDDKMGKKLKSALRLYYEIFMIYTNIDMSIINVATMLETLLLGDDEDNQRKKVSVRAACIIFDGMEKEMKVALASTVYFFYRYRNAIIHDGKTYLDFDEVQICSLVENMKHILFALVRYYYSRQPQSISEILQIVEENMKEDGLSNAFDYIRADAGEKYHFLLVE